VEDPIPAPSPAAPVQAEAPAADFEEILQNSGKNTAISEEEGYNESYNHKESEDTAKFEPAQEKNHLKRKILPVITALAGAVIAITAGLFGLHFRRKGRKGVKKDENIHEKKK
jgi:hypothetical protein